jgi:hypothetical protein
MVATAFIRSRLVALIGIGSLAAGPALGQQGSSPEKFKASGEHASFEWLFLPIGVAKRARVLDAKRPGPGVCPGSGFCSPATPAA